ncbi:hypothetical protein ACIGB8_28740 [Promicromonospora sukumoe]|uniref:hypothetical protein n=1 Tax=Promicromonospora sukumoe TaxID=88382 RepID=UPI0037C8681C
MGIFDRKTSSTNQSKTPKPDTGTVRPTGDGRYQAYDDAGRPIGTPQSDPTSAAVSGLHAWD